MKVTILTKNCDRFFVWNHTRLFPCVFIFIIKHWNPTVKCLSTLCRGKHGCVLIRKFVLQCARMPRAVTVQSHQGMFRSRSLLGRLRRDRPGTEVSTPLPPSISLPPTICNFLSVTHPYKTLVYSVLEHVNSTSMDTISI